MLVRGTEYYFISESDWAQLLELSKDVESVADYMALFTIHDHGGYWAPNTEAVEGSDFFGEYGGDDEYASFFGYSRYDWSTQSPGGL